MLFLTLEFGLQSFHLGSYARGQDLGGLGQRREVARTDRGEGAIYPFVEAILVDAKSFPKHLMPCNK